MTLEIQFVLIIWDVCKFSFAQTWITKAHACLYKVSHMAVHISVETGPWGQRLRDQFMLRLSSVDRCKNMSPVLKCPKSKMSSIVLQVKKSETNEGFTLSWPPSTTKQYLRMNLVSGWPRKTDGRSGWAPDLCGDERNFEKDKRHCSPPR